MARFLKLSEILPAKRITKVLLTQDGVRILEKGDTLDDRIFDALREFKIAGLVVADNDDDAEAYIRETRHTRTPVARLNVGDVISFSVKDDKGKVLIGSDSKLRDSDISLLVDNGVQHVWCPKNGDDASEANLGRLLLKLQQIKNSHRLGSISVDSHEYDDPDAPISVEIPADRLVSSADEISHHSIDREIDSASEEDLIERPSGPALSDLIKTVDPNQIRALGSVKAQIRMHGNVVSNAEQAYAQVKSRQQISGTLINSLATAVINGLVNDRAMTLNLSGLENSKHYVVRHAINTTLLSSSIAAYLGFSAHQIQELLFGAFLHDIGMMMMPSSITSKRDKLTPEEWIVMKTHPTKGLNALADVTQLPKSAALVVYQEQERCDGSGYPRHRSRGLIHTYAKIVSIASVYDALTADRPYRKAYIPYRAMEELLKMVNAGKLDSTAARALIHTLGLFPIGSWVQLSDKRIARVVSANGSQFTRPVVSVVFDGDGRQLREAEPLNLSGKENMAVSIVAPVRRPKNITGDERTIGF